MKKFILIVLIFATTSISAIETDKVAHLSTSFLLTTITYGFIRKTLGAPQTPSVIFSSAIVGFGALCKEGMTNSKMDANDMLYDGLGVGLSIGTVLIFNF